MSGAMRLAAGLVALSMVVVCSTYSGNLMATLTGCVSAKFLTYSSHLRSADFGVD